MSESLRTYFSSRKAYKAFLRRQKEICPGCDRCPHSKWDSQLSDYFASKDAYHAYVQRVYEAYRREIVWHGVKLVIEVEAGEADPHRQEPRRSPAPYAYGSIQDTLDKDLEPIDFFFGPDATSPVVWVVDQLKPTGEFDEHKVLLGFVLTTADDAKSAYLANYEDGWAGFGAARRYTIEQFKFWLQNYDPTQPVGKALGEASGGTGGYVSGIDWNNVRCPSCGGRLLCEECSGRKAIELGANNLRGDVVLDASHSSRDTRKESALAGKPFPWPQPSFTHWRTDTLDPRGVLSGAT